MSEANPANDHIREPLPYDVLLGRGAGANDWKGNQHFRDLVDERRNEYISCNKFEPKKQIAKDIVDKIHSLGGRFLRLVDTGKHLDSVVEEGTWKIVKEKVALEKVKQALREKNRPKSTRQQGLIPGLLKKQQGAQGVSATRQQSLGQAVSLFSTPSGACPLSMNGATSGGGLAPNMMAPMFVGNVGPLIVDPRLLLLQNAAFIQQQQPPIIIQPVGFSGVHFGHQAQGNLPARHGTAPLVQQPGPSLKKTSPTSSLSTTGRAAASIKEGHDALSDSTCSDKPQVASAAENKDSSRVGAEKEDALLALSALSVANRPRFSEQDEALEKASLTSEEKAEVLCDLFGKRCADSRLHKSKKARKDLDRDSIDFLINFMRGEIEKIPDERKQALLEARTKCKGEEFSAARLERFLRCEGMNAKLAAQRFVNYWEDRKSVFGPDKFTMPMTLSDALRDDLAAIEAGVYVLLPNRDTSGRQILNLDPRRYSKEICSPESLLRAYWYLIEVTSQENDDIGSGYINVVWDRQSTIFDYDKHVYDSITRFEKSSWPVKIVAHHICCPSRFTAALVKSIFFFLTDKRTRSRTKFHEVPESDILESLEKYGILKSMLPTKMGGGIDFNQLEWIAQRRVTETEEIA